MLAFVALGPIGNLLTPHFLPSAFRFYYFLLLGFPFFFNYFRERQLKLLIYFLPLLIYCFSSALMVEIDKSSAEPFPLFRFFLLFFHFLFVIGASSIVNTVQEKYDLITLYLKSFFITLLIGYFFYIGYYLDFISFSLIERFSVLGQFAYTLLRFSPGSYPNEYGTVASFVLSILTLLLLKPCDKIHLTKKSLLLFFSLTLIALLLTTTRSAYLSYFICFLYICRKEKRVLLPLFSFLFCILFIFIFMKSFNFDLFEFLLLAFNITNFQNGSMGERLTHWAGSFEDFPSQLLFGKGFASITNLHNVYLQFIFELGLLGMIILLATAFFRILNGPLRFYKSPDESIFSTLKTLGIIHVLWFALSNHNLNHHLTWFVLFLVLIPVKKMEEKPVVS